MKVFRVIISIILTILFLINILAISALSIAKATVLSENYMVSKLDDFKAYDGAKEMIDDAIDEASDNYGQEIQILKEFSTKENVKKLVDIGVGFLYENEYFLPSGEKLNELLDDNIDELIKEENIELTSDEKAVIKDVKNTIVTAYQEGLDEFAEENQVYNAIPEMITLIDMVFVLLIVVEVVLFTMLLLINLRNLSKYMKFFGCGIIVIGAFLLVFSAIVKAFDFNVIVEDASIENSIVVLARDIAEKANNFGKYYLIAGIGILVISIVIPIIINKFKKNQDTNVA